MSASRDKTQKVTFVYSNLYQLYKSGKETAQSAEVNAAPVAVNRNVLKTEDLRKAAVSPATQPKVSNYVPTEFIGRRLPKPEAIAEHSNSAVDSLKKNLEQLNDLHARLRFMLKELEDLVKE